MSVITLMCGSYCQGEQLVSLLREQVRYSVITDEEIVAKAADMSAISRKKIENVLANKPSIFNNITHEKERALAWMKLAMAETLLEADNTLIHGLTGHLIPDEITHVLRVCLIADMNYRLVQAGRETQVSEKEAVALIHKQDKEKAAWTDTLFGQPDPWSASLYDLVIPVDKIKLEEAVKLVVENLRSEVIQPTKASKRAERDFVLAAQVEVALARQGHFVSVAARDGAVTLTIHQNVLLLSRLEEELKTIAGSVDGVTSIETRLGKGFHKTDIYRKYDFETPRLLLVDDEREFVQTLSERLSMRDIDSAVVYDGESALDLMATDDPEVMILDLKMPGIDGFEVLRKTKETRPNVEVVILTGHGSEEDKATCMRLGAFAYLQKPVDIDELSATLKRAYDKVRAHKRA
ncbi:response regulator receiver protein [Desulfobulbus propionicus DSM 2032]|uniref:Response regulator receiver protein n=1 Tax=Desulfobulbus propionicus (strain ATCC 33891 / DSM 2032 / VKM B-1956 / 1pr3) TaxID=577650 RepID=A0A7U3YP73_DESPD|nr:response regulator [Desulfobulbus propionicus]ADW18985.1 response regulator receiver protein [Desulfobulbus propionicus DSM 2032]